MTLLPNKSHSTSFKIACIIILISSILEYTDIASNHILYILNMIALFYFYKTLNYNNYNRWEKPMQYTWSVIMLYNLILFIRLLLNHEGYSIGACFFHPFFLPGLLVFLLIMLDTYYIFSIIKYIPKLFFIAIILSPFFFDAAIIALTLYIFLAFLFSDMVWTPLSKKKKIMIILISILFIYKNGIIDDNRFILFMVLLLFTSHICICYFKHFIKYLWLIFITFPLIFSILLFYYNISLFNIKTTNDPNNNLYNDTRTFLFYEVAEYLIHDNILLTGAGLNGKVPSVLGSEIDPTIDTLGRRSFIEVNYLDIMRRGGGIYLIMYLILIIYPSYKALHANNNFMLHVSFFLATICVGSLIELPHGLKVNTIITMVCIALCCNSKLIKISNKKMEKSFCPFYKSKKLKKQS